MKLVIYYGHKLFNVITAILFLLSPFLCFLWIWFKFTTSSIVLCFCFVLHVYAATRSIRYMNEVKENRNCHLGQTDTNIAICEGKCPLANLITQANFVSSTYQLNYFPFIPFLQSYRNDVMQIFNQYSTTYLGHWTIG